MDPRKISQPEWDEDLRSLELRLAAGALFLVGVTLVGVLGYRIISPGSGWVDAFYMTAITLTTVGFGEIIDLQGNSGGRLFTAGLILVGMGGVLYFVSTLVEELVSVRREAAGVARAAGLLACTDNDKENLVITLSARQLEAVGTA